MSNRWGIPKHITEAVLKRDTRCVYCAYDFGETRASKRSWEHIVNDVSIVSMENIALCCVGCNASKGAKPLKEWLDSPSAQQRGITRKTLAPVVVAALESPPVPTEHTKLVFPKKDDSHRVSWATVQEMARKLGMHEEDLIHLALAKLNTEIALRQEDHQNS